jgi:hypothetical protein
MTKKESARDTSTSVYDPDFQVRSTLATIRANTELLQTTTGRERAALRNQNRQLRAKVRMLQKQMMDDYDPSFVECRDVGHQWVKSFVEPTDDSSIQRMLLCDRCESERHESFNQDGELLNRQYRHAQGYLLDPEMASMLKHSRNFWRGIEFIINSSVVEDQE